MIAELGKGVSEQLLTNYPKAVVLDAWTPMQTTEVWDKVEHKNDNDQLQRRRVGPYVCRFSFGEGERLSLFAV
jgi:hypothetical protein